jgi:hypothetical protein
MKLFLLVYGRELGTRPQIKACLNILPQVKSWRSELPNSFFIKSEISAKELANTLQTCLGVEKPKFFIVEIPPHTDADRSWGWLVHDSWVFLGRKADKKDSE